MLHPRGRTIFPPCKLPRYRFCSLFSFPCSGIPVIKSHCVWPDDDGYRNTERAQRYLSIVGGANPSLDPCQPNRRFQRYPQYTFIVTHLRCDVGYTQSTPMVSGSYTISWSKERILDIGKTLANELYDLYAMFRIGSCPSHHSPNDVIPLSMTSNVHSQETMTIC